MISCIIPISEKDFENGLMLELRPYLMIAKENCEEDIEVITVVNKPEFGRVRAKNHGAKKANGDTLVFLDVDCKIDKNFFREIHEKSKNDYFVGGGIKLVRLTRYSLPLIFFLFFLGTYLLIRQITVGIFWVRKDVFESIGGFRDHGLDDIDFAIRLKQYAKDNGGKFESLKESVLTWSTRKFDKFGDWSWINGYGVSKRPFYA